VAPVFDNLTLCERVYRHLRQQILEDQLPPGAELSEAALSRELAVSRGPIREAMGRLAAEGLVTVRPRRGAEVRSLTPQELIDAYQVREALEVMAVRLAVPRTTESDLTRLDELVDSMAEFAREDRVAEFFAANVAFHELLCQLSGNTSRFQARTLALRGSLESSVSEHRAILAAVRLGDMDEACELTAAHIRVPAQRLQESLYGGAQPTGPESESAAVTSSGPRDLLGVRNLVSSP
jgi:DNA-binding GntR family transcriptional regulator